MQVLKPIVHETVWGGPKLTPYTGTTSQSIGHLYAFVDSGEMKSEIVSGPDAGKNIHEWFMENRSKYNLQNYEELPILGAMMEANQTLSVQVHPDDERAKSLEGSPFGKNESFYIIDAPSSGWMYNGCTAASVENVSRSIQQNRIQDVLRTLPCKAGDYIYIEAGTIHAATAGSLNFEVEENCALTYRFYDFDRTNKDGTTRPLQIEKALQCLDVTKRSVTRQYNDERIEERMYVTAHIRGRETFVNDRSMFAFAVMIKGDRTCSSVHVLPGTAILLEPEETLDVAGAEFIVVWPKAHVT